MQIISNFTDYYDQMLQYGVDKSITFNRINSNGFKPTKPQEWQLNLLKSEELSEAGKKTLRLKLPEYNNQSHENDAFIIDAYRRNEFKVNAHQPFMVEEVQAVINGKVFTAYMLMEYSSVQNPHEHYMGGSYRIAKKNASMEDLYNNIKENRQYFSYSYLYRDGIKDIFTSDSYEQYCSKKYKEYRYGDVVDATEQQLLKVHQELDTPVFFLYSGKVLKNLPLSYFGMFNVFDSNMEKTHQEIAYCIGNVLQNKNEPPASISNNDKIVQHGFDKKISFRHR